MCARACVCLPLAAFRRWQRVLWPRSVGRHRWSGYPTPGEAGRRKRAVKMTVTSLPTVAMRQSGQMDDACFEPYLFSRKKYNIILEFFWYLFGMLFWH